MPATTETTAVQSNGSLTEAEERIRLAVQEKMSDRIDGYMKNLNDVLGQNMDAVNQELQRNMQTVDLRFETYLEQQKGRDRDIKEELEKVLEAAKSSDASIEELKLAAKGLKKANDEIEELKRLAKAQSASPMFPGLSEIVKPDKQQEFIAGQLDLIKEIGKRAKNTPQAQRMMYNAADSAARFLTTPGSTKKYHHLTTTEVSVGLGVATVVGVGLGVGGTLLVQNRSLKKAGYDRKQYKQWLSDGRDRVKAKSEKK